ncbi:hypothetical protein EG829_24755, partial [bacterium]|nr:hypothetical protein [bacterium]
TDYQASAGTIQFNENETIKGVRIPLLRSRAAEGSKSFRVSLSNATPGVTVGTSTAWVDIVGAYLMVAPPFDPGLAMRRESGLNLLSWTGGGRLQRADRPNGPWQTLNPSSSTVQSPVPASFYRVKNPRPADLYVPSSYDGHTPLPLVINLHGMGGSGLDEERYTTLRPLAEARGFLYCCPDATVWFRGSTYWNAFFSNSAEAAVPGFTWVDDVAFLRGLIHDIGQRFALDRKRVFLIGYSNGGMMVHWAACQCADLVAGIAALDGLAGLYPHRASEGVNVLHIHGTADGTVSYADEIGINPNSPVVPGAEQITRIWADFNGASGRTTDAAPSLDLTTDLPGLDTVVTRYAIAPPGGAVELWTIIGGTHHPTLSSDFGPRVVDWLLAHPKP